MKVSVSHILGSLVLEARHGSYLKNRGYSEDQWSCQISDCITVGYEGHPLDEKNVENIDVENYIVTISLKNDQYVSFFVDVEECRTAKPKVNFQYIKDRYEDDIEDQLRSTSISKKRFESYLINLFKAHKEDNIR